MKRFPTRLFPVLLVAGCLLLSACSASTGGTSTTGNTSQATSTPQPTATVVKPSSVPQLTVALCQQMLSISEANHILNPTIAINNIVPDNGPTGGSCNYEYAPSRVEFLFYFEDYKGGQLSQLAQMAVDASADGQLKNTTLTANQQVSGIGDQAWFLAGTATDSGFTGHVDVLYVVYGGVAFGVENITFNGIGSLGSYSDSTLESEFEQIAPMVISAL